MPRILTRIVGPQQAPGLVATTIYTVPAGTKVVLRYIHIVNGAAAAQQSFVISIGNAAAFNVLWVAGAGSLVAGSGGEWERWCEIPMEAGEFLQMVTSSNPATLAVTIDALVCTLG